MSCGIFKLDGTPFTNEDIITYINNTIDRVFAVLVTYEECSKENDFEAYEVYIDRLIVEFNGIHKWLNIKQFFSLKGVLEGMSDTYDISRRIQIKENKKREVPITDEELRILVHKEIKRLTFHCISILNKAKVM